MTAFCFELAKKLDMRYSEPSMPVNIHMGPRVGEEPSGGSVNNMSLNVDSMMDFAHGREGAC